MTLRFVPIVLLLVSNAACSSSGSSGAGSGGAGSAGLGGTSSGGGGQSGGSSGSGGSAGSSGSGGNAGSGGTASCTPSGGNATLDVYCDGVTLAVLETSGKPAGLRVAGRLVASDGTCLKPESVELVRPDKSVAQKLTASGDALTSWNNVHWASADAAAEISARCKDELDRIEPYGIIVKGLSDGGKFEAKCGTGVEMGSSWPPRVMLTCHSGLTRPPAFGNAMVQPMGPITSTTLYGQFPHEPGPGVTSVDPSIRIVPFASPFGGGTPVAPFDTTGWTVNLSESNIPVTAELSTSLNAFSDKDLLGDACPLPAPMDAALPTPPPFFFARLTGQGPLGAFSGELVVSMCTRATK
ncbi:MAG: hypothetical protein IPM35_12025 [Myxococcales bacterium]|nr:hypothetical protein [Myxococcales bacterium]